MYHRYALVTFETEEAADKAIEATDRQPLHDTRLRTFKLDTHYAPKPASKNDAAAADDDNKNVQSSPSPLLASTRTCAPDLHTLADTDAQSDRRRQTVLSTHGRNRFGVVENPSKGSFG